MIDDVTKIYQWDDPTQYIWIIKGRRYPFRIWSAVGPIIGLLLFLPLCGCIVTLIASVILAMVYFAGAHILGFQSLLVGDAGVVICKLWVGKAIMLFLVAFTLYLFFITWKGSPKQKLQAQSNIDELLSSSFGVVIFIMMNLLGKSFKGDVSSYGQWFYFFIQHAFTAISLGFWDVFVIRLSDIEPQTWYARLGTTFFEFIMTAGFLRVLWMAYKRRYFHENVSGTVREFFWVCQNMLDRETVEMRREGKVQQLAISEPFISMVAFVEALTEVEYTEGRKATGAQAAKKPLLPE